MALSRGLHLLHGLRSDSAFDEAIALRLPMCAQVSSSSPGTAVPTAPAPSGKAAGASMPDAAKTEDRST